MKDLQNEDRHQSRYEFRTVFHNDNLPIFASRSPATDDTLGSTSPSIFFELVRSATGATFGIREVAGHKPIRWMKVVLTGLIDYAHLSEAHGCRVRNCSVDFPTLQGHFIASIVQADD
jgi:hypothetical protein